MWYHDEVSDLEIYISNASPNQRFVNNTNHRDILEISQHGYELWPLG